VDLKRREWLEGWPCHWREQKCDLDRRRGITRWSALEMGGRIL